MLLLNFYFKFFCISWWSFHILPYEIIEWYEDLLILDYIQIISNNQIENSKSWASFEIESSIIKMNIKSHDTKYDVAVTRKIY